MVANINLVSNDIKTIFYKNWYQKADILFETLIYIIKTFTIKAYFIIYANINSIITYFYLFIISKLKNYVLNLDLGFLDAIIKVTYKIA